MCSMYSMYIMYSMYSICSVYSVYMNTFQYFLVISALALARNTSCVLCNFCIVKYLQQKSIQIVHTYVHSVYVQYCRYVGTVVLCILK